LPIADASPDYYYYVNSFSGTYVDWESVGTSPYLNAVDYPSNYVYIAGAKSNKKIGNFGFQDAGSEQSETISKVFVEINGYASEDPDIGYPAVRLYVYDGSTWTLYSYIPLTSTKQWISVDVSSKINTWAKVNACQIYLVYIGYTPFQDALVDTARIKVQTITKTWHNVGLWAYGLSASKWNDVGLWSWQISTFSWHNVGLWNFFLNVRQWHNVLSWQFQIYSEILKQWHLITIWSFSLEVERRFPFIILAGAIFIIIISVIYLLKR